MINIFTLFMNVFTFFYQYYKGISLTELSDIHRMVFYICSTEIDG